MNLTTNNTPAAPRPVVRPPLVAALDRAITRVNTLLTEFNDLPGLAARREEFEDGIAELLRMRDALGAVIDPDGSLRNWLVDVVREVRRGNPGAARFELDQLSKRLETLRAQWK